MRFVGLNVAPFDAHKVGALALVADARAGLAGLAAVLAPDWEGTDPDYRAEATERAAAWRTTVDDLRRPRSDAGGLAQAEVLGAVHDAFGDQAVVVNAAGSMPGDLLKLWRTADPRAYHVEYGFSCMGYEIPAGIGVALAEPDREIVVFVGDGSYLMMNSELVTAVAEGLAFTVVLVENGGFQSIHGLQRSVGVPSFANERRARDPRSGRLDGPVVAVDFAAHAAAMGARTWSVRDVGGLREALVAARAAPGVRVVVVATDPERRVPGFDGWWDVPPAEVSDRPDVRAARAAYRTAAARRRAHSAVATPPPALDEVEEER